MATKKRANGEGTIHFSEREQRWWAEITWIDADGNKRRKKWKNKKTVRGQSKTCRIQKATLATLNDITNYLPLVGVPTACGKDICYF